MGEIRKPAVSGLFYPSEKKELKRMIHELSSGTVEKRNVKAILSPHAGYIYSGKTAGLTISSGILPKKIIITCPNHTGLGPPLSVSSDSGWLTPLGEVIVDEKTREELITLCSALEGETSAHIREHAIEVQLPFLQELYVNFTFCPIVIGTINLTALRSLGSAIAEYLKNNEDAGLLISSDMNHYENARINKKKDDKAIKKMLDMDPEGLYKTVITESISMCGFAGATSVLFALKEIGIKKAELISYTHSGEITGDDSSVVSYAGMHFL